MSRAVVCDNCETSLVLNDRGEDPAGEIAGWLRLTLSDIGTVDLCTRACAHEYLDRPEVIEALDAYQEVIADIARAVRDEHDDSEGGAS